GAYKNILAAQIEVVLYPSDALYLGVADSSCPNFGNVFEVVPNLHRNWGEYLRTYPNCYLVKSWVREVLMLYPIDTLYTGVAQRTCSKTGYQGKLLRALTA
ncbi:unnamed protein product, partial [Sphacelaria rigidula]